MKIDAHQHFWHYSPEEYGWIDESMQPLKRDYLPVDLESVISANGISGTVAVQARQTIRETEWLLSLAKTSPFIKGVVGWVDLCSSALDDQLGRFSEESSLVGVRHVVQDEADDRFMLRDTFIKGIETLGRYNLAYDILVIPKQLPAAIELVSRFPGQRFILDHIAKPPIRDQKTEPWAERIGELASFSNVTCKVSGMVTEADWTGWKPEHFTPYLDVIFKHFGAERTLFGSDWPVCTLAGSYTDVQNIVMSYLNDTGCTLEDIDKVLGGNALKIYNLNPE